MSIHLFQKQSYYLSFLIFDGQDYANLGVRSYKSYNQFRLALTKYTSFANQYRGGEEKSFKAIPLNN